MKKTLAVCLLALCLSLTACSGDTVIYQVQCDHEDLPQTDPQPVPEPESDAVKTGLAIRTDISGSRSAEGASYEVLVAAVSVDDEGVIRACTVDSVRTQLPFDENGVISTPPAAVPTAKDSGEGAAELAAIADFAVGKQLAQLRLEGDAIPAPWLDVLETAAVRARHLGASVDDELRLALLGDLSGSLSATEGEAGRARLGCDAAAVTFDGDTITACRIDSVQADVVFDAMGTVLSDVNAAVKTKTELGEDYGMKRYGGAKYEWYEQAEHFADYVTGKTAAQVAAIAVAEGKPANADLATSVTISITPFQALIARAAGGGA